MARKPESRGRGRRKVSRAEADLFKAAVGDAEPPPDRGDRPAAPSAETGRPAAMPAPEAPAPAAPLPELQAGIAAGVDARTMERLRRGQIRPEARLDLHGLTQDEAHAALRAFIPGAQAAGRRCVVVITGRGRVSAGGGVLRAQVPRWLNLPALRARVLGFAQAQPKDGGAGALYVLLRRRR